MSALQRHHVWRNSELAYNAKHPDCADEPEASFRSARDALAYIEAPVPSFGHSRKPEDYTIVYQGDPLADEYKVIGATAHGNAILDILNAQDD